ncbi:DUF1294 domain-containing protein [Rhodopirellula halodulae]|uniref:DUF1294 domain-containing protein n=1 Tax=Rhodopirellula halodulae TaxID=2894198 RepID=UPI001E3FCDAA|nr:DUF1294 domain-containing protein [Rhodopirellula sp. JC737]MCC9655508.1 DUF1294 domain-containing protein [Rhodopirellula sp. JC737]
MTLPPIIATEVVFASAVTAVLYWIDKRAARASKRRIPENVLLTASALGGWPGAIFAGRRLRHKTAKTSYRIRFAIAVAIHVILAALVLWIPRRF